MCALSSVRACAIICAYILCKIPSQNKRLQPTPKICAVSLFTTPLLIICKIIGFCHIIAPAFKASQF